MSKLAYVGAISLAVCAGIGWTLHDSNSSSDAVATVARTETAQPRSVRIQPNASVTLDAAQLRAIIREEVAAALVDTGRNAQSVGEMVQVAAPVSRELLAQSEQAQQEIEAMIAGGVWGNEERLNFQRKLALLTPEQAQQALQQVTMALNSGGLQVMTDGPAI